MIYQERILKCSLKLKTYKKECMRRKGKQRGSTRDAIWKEVQGLLATHVAGLRRNIEIGQKVSEVMVPIKGQD